jgi:hypothetical protein
VAKYGNITYGGSKYGDTPKLVYSVEPFILTVLDFTKVYVSWQSPSGDFSRIRLVRNQTGFPETAEDGVIVWDEFATAGNVSRSSIIDGVDNPTSISVVPGRPIYYSMFLYNGSKVWIPAGKITDIVARDHGSHKKIMDIIPKVFTSKEQSALHVTDETSALYNFMYGFSITYDQLLTLVELSQPLYLKEGSPFSLLRVENENVALDPEPSLPVRSQKKLIREALYMYGNKGLKLGLETYVESFTGYSPTITVSPNLLLTVQDSTFYQSTGNWVFTDATAEESDEQVPAPGDNVIDGIYSCKVTATNAFTMNLGANTPVTKGVPVQPEVEYITSVKIKSPASAGNVTVSVKWYDGTGAFIETDNGSSVSANNTWKSASVVATSPVDAVYAAIQVSGSAAGVYYVDQVCMQEGDAIEYDEARAITIELSPNKINYIKNPSFEVDDSNWTTTGATFSQDSNVPTFGYTGDYSGKFVAASAWDVKTSYAIPVNPGQYYTASFYVASDDSTEIECSIEFYNLEDELVSTFEAVEQPISDTFSQVTVTGITDSSSDAVYAIFKITGGVGTFYLDLLQFERSFVATEYFDGSMPSEYGNIWQGTADASYSLAYYNKPLKIPRLSETIMEWVPQNAFWRIKTLAGLEFTNPTV